MEENAVSRCPRAAGGLTLVLAGILLSSAGGVLYRWGLPLAAGLTAAPGGILLAVGLYRAGADEPGFYHALAYQAVSLAVNQSRGYFGYQFYAAGLLLYGAATLLSLRALNLACAAAARQVPPWGWASLRR